MRTGSAPLDHVETITIYDAFGFYSKAFTGVAESLVPIGYATKEDCDTIALNKAKRHEFNAVDFTEVQHYCGLELVLISKALTVLRDGFDKMEISLPKWSGAGSAAGALIGKRQLRKEHFSTSVEQDGKRLILHDIRKTDISPQQDASHHGFIGGRIELLKQGYAPN